MVVAREFHCDRYEPSNQITRGKTRLMSLLACLGPELPAGWARMGVNLPLDPATLEFSLANQKHGRDERAAALRVPKSDDDKAASPWKLVEALAAGAE